MTDLSLLCGGGLHGQCPGEIRPQGLAARPCECGCHD